MKTEKTKLFKLYYFDFSLKRYFGISGLYRSIDEFLSNTYITPGTHWNIIKIPFFGYYSPQFTGFDLRALAGTRRPEF